MHCKGGLIIWWAVKLVARLHREGAEVGSVECQRPPVQRLLLPLVLVGHDSELVADKPKVRRKVDGGVEALRRLAAEGFRN
jgi:hypothetical protein